MTTRRFQVLLQWDPESRVWAAYVPVLDHLSTSGQTREEALAHTQEAILGYIEAAQKAGLPVPDEEAEAQLVDVEVAIA
jgi:predicted RNase H-like HicB family nuclease